MEDGFCYGLVFDLMVIVVVIDDCGMFELIQDIQAGILFGSVYLEEQIVIVIVIDGVGKKVICEIILQLMDD